MQRVDRERLDAHLDSLSYPVTRDDAAAAFAETEVVIDGDNTTNLGRLISEVGSDAFQNPGDLADEVEESLAERGDE